MSTRRSATLLLLAVAVVGLCASANGARVSTGLRSFSAVQGDPNQYAIKNLAQTMAEVRKILIEEGVLDPLDDPESSESASKSSSSSESGLQIPPGVRPRKTAYDEQKADPTFDPESPMVTYAAHPIITDQEYRELQVLDGLDKDQRASGTFKLPLSGGPMAGPFYTHNPYSYPHTGAPASNIPPLRHPYYSTPGIAPGYPVSYNGECPGCEFSVHTLSPQEPPFQSGPFFGFPNQYEYHFPSND